MMEKVVLNTWPLKPKGVQEIRDYSIEDQDGNAIAYGKTQWAVLDTEKGSLVKIDEVFSDDWELETETVLDEPFARVKEDISDCEEAGKYEIRSIDIDLGGHMNNAAYVKALFSIFTTSELDAMKITDCEICYKHSCYEGDTLTFYKRQRDNAIEMIGKTGDGETAMLAVLKRIDEIVSEIGPELKKLALDIHDNPELGNEEFKACKWQTELLEKYGFSVEREFCGIPTAYRATYKGAKPGPRIGMLGEFDALPGLGHACGHNLICTMAVGSGITMREFADEFGGEIVVIGTPAEETAGAKVEMSKKHAFDDLDVAMMSHPAYADCDSLNTNAIKCFQVEFFGRAAHAAAFPEDGINALDAMIQLFVGVGLLRQQTKDGSRIPVQTDICLISWWTIWRNTTDISS
jgi:acyl-ACP thioesterase